MLMEKHLDTTGAKTVKQETVVKYFKKHEISNACSHTENVAFGKTDTTTASVTIVIILWTYITRKKLHIVLPFCRVSICEFEVQKHAKKFFSLNLPFKILVCLMVCKIW